MKYISRLLFTVGLVFGLTACTEDAYETTVPELPAKGDMSVNITFAMSDVAAQTRSKVSGDEQIVKTMQLVCFDANGLYLGIRDADVTSNGAGTNPPMYDTGTIKGTVPEGTSRIHFIANRNLSIPLNAVVGTSEADVMNSEELSTLWSDKDHTYVCYWGYHKEASAEAMESWLKPATPGASKVYMIRDRARIVLTYDPTGATVPVTKIEWLIHNGRERGYLAPAQKHWGEGTNTPYWGNSTQSGHESDIISVAEMNEYTKCGRYSLWTSDDENDQDNFDVAYEAGTTISEHQFLFDDTNNDDEPLKAILRVTYTVQEGSSSTSRTVYHVLKLNDDNQVQYDVVRNKTYYIKAKLLNPDVAFYETLKEAIEGKEFVNADMEVSRDITDINNDQYTLQIKLPTETTSTVFNTPGAHTMDFVFRMVSDVNTSGSTDPYDFEVTWEDAQSFCETALPVTYNSTTKQFTIKATVLEDKITDHLQGQWIKVKHTASGLTRYIHVYVIDQFRYVTQPSLKKVGTVTVPDPNSTTGGTKSVDAYLLSFKIPPAEHTRFLPDGSPDPDELIYPAGLYPIDVKFTTNTLNAYSANDIESTDYEGFGVSIENTMKGVLDLTQSANFETDHNTPRSSINTSDMTHWYFQQEAKPWDFWYTYSIKNYDDFTNKGVVNIYLADVKDHIQYAEVKDVGLFLRIEYFGKIYSMPVTTN